MSEKRGMKLKLPEVIIQDGFTFVQLTALKNTYYKQREKDGSFSSSKRKSFNYHKCKNCGKLISNCGFAYSKHDKMHERENQGRR